MSSDYARAAKLRDVIKSIVKEVMNEERPDYRYATVETVDRPSNTVEVRYEGEEETQRLPLGQAMSAAVGQTVRVAGNQGDRYVDDITSSAGATFNTGAWIPLSRHGARKDSLFDNTEAFNSAIAEAIEEGSPGVMDDVVPVNNGDRLMVEGRVYFDDATGFLGRNPMLSVVQCVDPGAGLDFSKYDDVGHNGGFSGFFSILGGPGGSLGTGIATRPFVIGKRTGARFSNIIAWYANPTGGCNVILDSTQNSYFDTIWGVEGYANLRFDRGATGNSHMKCEYAGAYGSNVEFRNTGTPPSGQFSFCLANYIGGGTILEGSTTSTVHLINAVASALNAFENVYISVNGDLFGSGLPSAMDSIVYAAGTEGGAGQGSLMMGNCQIDGGDAANMAVYADAANLGRIHWRGGRLGSIPLGMKGGIIVESEPWWFGSVTQKYDLTGILTVTPRHEYYSPNYSRMASTGEVVMASQVIGESNLRIYMLANGAFVAGDGTNSTDVSWGRVRAGAFGTISGHINCGNWNQAHITTPAGVHLWCTAAGVWRTKTSAPSSEGDGVAVGSQ